MFPTSCRRALLFAAVLIASGCAQPTEIYVLVSADPSDAASVAVVTVSGPDGALLPRAIPLRVGETGFLVRPVGGDANRLVTIEIEGCRVVPDAGVRCRALPAEPPEPAPLWSTLRFRTRFVPGRRLTIRAVLSEPCDSRVFPDCPPGELCRSESGVPVCEAITNDYPDAGDMTLPDAGLDAPLGADTGESDGGENDGGVDANIDAPGAIVVADAGYVAALESELFDSADMADIERGVAGLSLVGAGRVSIYEGGDVSGLSPEAGDGRFGFRVAISDDGSRIVVGAPSTSAPGTVRLYVDTGTWASSELSSPIPSSVDGFGRAVAIAGDGGCAAVGSSRDQGHAYVFCDLDTMPAQRWELVPSATLDTGADFGTSVAVSSAEDDRRVIVGAPGHGPRGTAWIFRWTGAAWAQEAVLSGPATTGQFGTAVAISGEGTEAVVGAPGGDVGAGYAYRRTGTVWTPSGTLTFSSGSGVGRSVALSRDGSRALVGEYPLSLDSNRAYLFVQVDTDWIAGRTIEGFGHDVALSGDGRRALLVERVIAPEPRGALQFLNILGP